MSWSGGKDSCLACHKAILEGHDVYYLMNTVSEEYSRVRFHGFRDKVVQAQAEALGIKLFQSKTSGENYERDFKNGVKSLISKEDIHGIVFGDLHLESGLEWTQRICKELGIKCIQPLWKKPVKEVLIDFIDSGFEAYVTSLQADKLDKSFIGRKLDKKFLDDISKLGIDVCGENGEYHTLVVDGPIFKKRLEILETEKVLRDGYWFLDVKEYRLVDKKKHF